VADVPDQERPAPAGRDQIPPLHERVVGGLEEDQIAALLRIELFPEGGRALVHGGEVRLRYPERLGRLEDDLPVHVREVQRLGHGHGDLVSPAP
jgi:hypothetical protein